MYICFYLLQEYKPRWGYKRANDDTKDWLIEVPQNAGKLKKNKAEICLFHSFLILMTMVS